MPFRYFNLELTLLCYDTPSWVFVFLIIPVIMVVAGKKTRLIVSDGMLRYERVFGGEEVNLSKVLQIVTREVETIVEKEPDRLRDNKRQTLNRHSNHANQERKVERIVYVLDESGRTFFSFPAHLIGLSNRRRFEEAVKSVNPKIKVS